MHPGALISVSSRSHLLPPPQPFAATIHTFISPWGPSIMQRWAPQAVYVHTQSVWRHTNRPKCTDLKIHTHTEGLVHSVSPVWFIDGHSKGLLHWRPLSCRQAHLQTLISKVGGWGGPRVTPVGCPWCQQDTPLDCHSLSQGTVTTNSASSSLFHRGVS